MMGRLKVRIREFLGRYATWILVAVGVSIIGVIIFSLVYTQHVVENLQESIEFKEHFDLPEKYGTYIIEDKITGEKYICNIGAYSKSFCHLED